MRRFRRHFGYKELTKTKKAKGVRPKSRIPTPRWMFNINALRDFLASVFPDTSSLKKRKQQGRWALVIRYYFCNRWNARQVASLANTSKDTIEQIVKDIRSKY